MEKWADAPAPVPPSAPIPEGSPVDRADIVEADTSEQGPMVTIDGNGLKTTAVCSTFNQLMINGGQNVVTVKGICRQIMINGDGNRVTADAASEFVFNGNENVLKYAGFVNGKRPVVIENLKDNTIEQVKQTK